MGNWLINFFAPGLKLPPGSQEWNPGFEGLAPGWAFLIFLALAGACIWAYRRYAPEITNRRRIILITLRLLALAQVGADFEDQVALRQAAQRGKFGEQYRRQRTAAGTEFDNVGDVLRQQFGQLPCQRAAEQR